MSNLITPKNHTKFKAIALSQKIDDEINDCAIAFIEVGGGGPLPDHTHEHDHLFTVISGQISVIVERNQLRSTLVSPLSLRVENYTPYGI